MDDDEEEEEKLEFYDFSTLGYLSHYVHTCIVHRGVRKVRQKLDTERQGLSDEKLLAYRMYMV